MNRRARPAPSRHRGAALAASLLLALALAGCAVARPPPAAASRVGTDAAGDYGTRASVRRFAAEVAARRALPPDWVREQLARARLQPRVQRLMMPKAVIAERNWNAYRARIVEPARIEAGVAFWDEHAGWLERAEREYGVPAAVVVGIVGVETYYGRVTGGFRVLDALATLAFDFPAGRSDRSAFFRDELEAFLALAHAEGWDAAAVQGSFAGAIGLPQFMPSSIERFAVDFDGDGGIDLAANGADAIGSIANFLARHGWQRALPATFEVAPPEAIEDLALMLAPDIDPSFAAVQFAQHGARLEPAALGFGGKLALVRLDNGSEPPSYVAGTANFHALTRYNRSSSYAMAVLELGSAVERTRAVAAAPAPSPAAAAPVGDAASAAAATPVR